MSAPMPIDQPAYVEAMPNYEKFTVVIGGAE
jgi:hypothetical protein